MCLETSPRCVLYAKKDHLNITDYSLNCLDRYAWTKKGCLVIVLEMTKKTCGLPVLSEN